LCIGLNSTRGPEGARTGARGSMPSSPEK